MGMESFENKPAIRVVPAEEKFASMGANNCVVIEGKVDPLDAWSAADNGALTDGGAVVSFDGGPQEIVADPGKLEEILDKRYS